ncbi:MAG: MSMEG_6728 family protein [bacterium]|nr:MSMEG_6728 family protein [bacterium]MDT8395939.1 MSMEG_6728 family protein [bacterium]
MQTFLPYPDFGKTAQVLDNRRLGRQRVEAYQILRTLSGLSKGWRNHPAVRMWRGYEMALSAYMNAMIDEWERRGYRNTMFRVALPVAWEKPPWLGDEALHRAYRSNLLRKDPDHFGRFWPGEPDDLEYVWPG